MSVGTPELVARQAGAAGLWLVDEAGLVREVLRRPEDFAPDNALTAVVPLAPATLRRLARARFALPPVLASASGPEHRRVRTVVTGFFTPRTVAAVRPRVVELTRARAEWVAGRVGRGETVDLATELSRRVVPRVLGELIGLALPEPGMLRRWSVDSLELFWGLPGPGRQLVLAESAVELFGWLAAQVDAPPPAGSLIGALAGAGVDRARTLSLVYFLVIAGQETTAMLTDTALLRVLRSPTGWQVAGRSAEGAGALVREVLGEQSSVHTWRRVAARDTVLGGRPVPAGTELLLRLSGRADGDPGLAFGYGVHRCVGARLAELQASTVLAEAAAALPGLRAAGPDPAWLRLLSFQAPATVLVTA